MVISQLQPYNYANHYGKDLSYNIVTLGPNNYYLTAKHEIPYCCFQQLEMVTTDVAGTEINRLPVFFYPWLQKCSITLGGDSNLLVIGGTDLRYCDYGQPLSEICKVSPTGSVLWRKIHQALYHIISPSSGNTYYLLQDDKIVNWADTIPVDTVIPGVTGIEDMLIRPDSCFLLSYTTAATPRLRLISPSGATIKDIATNSLYTDLSITNGVHFALAGGQLVSFSDSLATLHQSSSQYATSWPVRAYYPYQTSIVAVCQGPGGQSGYAVFDSLLTVTFSATAPSHSTLPTGITCNSAGRLTFVTTGSCTTWDYSFTGLHSTNVGDALKAGKDVGVINYTVLSAHHVTNTTAYGIGLAELSVTVKNFGNDTVRRFKINNYGNSGFMNCLLGISKQFDLQIAPGDSVTVNTGTFYIGVMNSAPGDTAFSYHFCVYTSVPDSTNDVNISNDVICRTYKIPVLGVKEIVADNVRIIPNPSSGRFTIESNDLLRSIELRHIDGTLILQKDVNSISATIDYELPIGCYLLRWSGYLGSGVSKILVVD